MGQRRIERTEPGGGVLARLVSELGRAAQAGWGPTARWLVFLVVLTTALAIITELSH